MSNVVQFKPREKAQPKYPSPFDRLMQDHCEVGFCYYRLCDSENICTGCTNNKNDGGPDDAA